MPDTNRKNKPIELNDRNLDLFTVLIFLDQLTPINFQIDLLSLVKDTSDLDHEFFKLIKPVLSIYRGVKKEDLDNKTNFTFEYLYRELNQYPHSPYSLHKLSE